MAKSKFSKAVKLFEKTFACSGFLGDYVKLETFRGSYNGEKCSHYVPSENVLRVNTQAYDVTSELIHEAAHALAFQTFKSDDDFFKFMAPLYPELKKDTKISKFLTYYKDENDHIDEAFAEGIAQAFKNPKWETGQKLINAVQVHMRK